MTYDDDLDLARRLRRVSEDPEPEVPASLYRFVDSVAEGATAANEATGTTTPIAFRPVSRRSGRSQVRIMAGLAAALVIVMVGGALLVAWQRGSAAASPSLAPDQWTGLQWHDITATANGLFTREAWAYGIGSGDAVAWSGGLAAIDGSGLWTSTDGLTWTKVPGAPSITLLASLGGKLIGVGWTSHACSLASVKDVCNWAGGIWISSDGTNWQSVSVPFAGQVVDSISTTSKGAVVVTSPVPVPNSNADGPYSVYATPDGVTWTKASFPDDVSQASFLIVSSVREGYLLTSTSHPTAEQSQVSTSSGNEAPSISQQTWSSPDGITWARAQLDFPTQAAGMEGAAYVGRLGDATVTFTGFHSTDGIHWVADSDQVVTETDGGGGMMQIMADGRHILVSYDWAPVFKVSLGDGHWQTLVQGGDIGSLPGGGQVMLLPNGVLYAGGGRLFYGQAVSGTPVAGTLHPAASISAPPTPTPTPGTPRPSVTLPPATAWTGVSGISKVAGGPAGATSVTRWKGGYVAMRNAPSSGGLLTVWISPDGKKWTQLPDGTFGKATTAVCAQVADQVVIATWGGANSVWVSSDGTNWSNERGGNGPVGDRPMVGNSWGMVAIMDDPQYQLEFGLDFNLVTIPGADVNSIQGVAVAGDRFVAVGHLTGSDGSTKPAAWWSEDGTIWTAATVDDAPGDGFVSVAAGRNGYVGMGSAAGSSAGSKSFWTSMDGKTWHRSTAMGPFPGAASFVGNGTRILGWGPGSDGAIEFWISLDGQHWTRLALVGDTAMLLSSGANVRAYLLDNGVLFVTPDGAWFAVAVV